MLTMEKYNKLKTENNMRYALLPSKKTRPKKQADIALLASVPSADLPYWIDHTQSTSQSKHIFKWEYGANQEPLGEALLTGLQLIYGKNSGCLYHAEIDNDKLTQISSLENSIRDEISKKSQHFAFGAKRFQNNLSYGLAILQRVCNQVL